MDDGKTKLKLLLKTITDFNDDQLDRGVRSFHERRAGKGEILLRSGDTCKKFYYVGTGSIRTFFLSKSGIEKTRLIVSTNMIGTAFTSFITNKPSFEYVEALEDTELLAIGRHDFYALCGESDQWRNFYRKILEMAYVFQNERIEALVTKSAEERYVDLRERKPDWFQRFPNGVMASYLDMAAETLSRLKSRSILRKF